MENSIFNSNFSSSNPFGIGGTNSSTDSLENSLMNTYAKLEALKARQNQLNNSLQQPVGTQSQIPQQSTVFSDIANELKDLSDDENMFIVSSPEYQKANALYQEDFSKFLINKFANEYLQVGNSKNLEEMLFVIRQQKEKYKKKFAADINDIRDQNKQLLDKNNELAENNQKLQAQLLDIQKRLSSGGNA